MSSPITPELQSKLFVWRQKAADGTISLDDMREAIKALRAGRQSAVVESKASGGTRKAKGPARSADDLLGELGL
jgi:hypothetical protein